MERLRLRAKNYAAIEGSLAQLHKKATQNKHLVDYLSRVAIREWKVQPSELYGCCIDTKLGNSSAAMLSIGMRPDHIWAINCDTDNLPTHLGVHMFVGDAGAFFDRTDLPKFHFVFFDGQCVFKREATSIWRMLHRLADRSLIAFTLGTRAESRWDPVLDAAKAGENERRAWHYFAVEDDSQSWAAYFAATGIKGMACVKGYDTYQIKEPWAAYKRWAKRGIFFTAYELQQRHQACKECLEEQWRARKPGVVRRTEREWRPSRRFLSALIG